MAKVGSDWSRIFSQRYRFALLILAALWSIGSIIEFRLSQAERRRAELITLSMEQAGLSQRIAFLTSDLDPNSRSCRDYSHCQRLLQASQQMARNHKILAGEDPEFVHFLGPVEELYDAGLVPFHDEVVAFYEASRALAVDTFESEVDRHHQIDLIAQSGTSNLMQTHGLIVAILESEAERAIERIGMVTALVWALSILIIFLVSTLIFAPMASRMGRMLSAMERAQKRAIDAAAKAEQANRARGQFLKTASHELKTPLNAIMGLAEVLRAGEDQADKLLLEMEHASDHLLSMLNTMLDTHRMEEGRLEINPSPTHLGKEMTSISDIARDMARRKGLDFTSSVHIPDEFQGEVDMMRLRSICLNIIDNAVRYTETGRIDLRSLLSNSDDGYAVSIIISDTGAGMTEEKIALLFDRAGRQNLTPGAGGMGLGLLLSKTLVEMMKGTIEVTSEVGEGSRFQISIPVTPTKPLQIEPAASACEETRILVVDDNHPNRLVAEAMMKMLGGISTMAENGQEAVDLAGEQPFDLILMDVAMPVMDGTEATRTIRREAGPNQDTPIIAVTAHAAPEDVAGLRTQGFQEVVHKPMRKGQMTELYNRYVLATQREQRTGS